jgi:colanic acid/amylovoran biosynthesis glycosyltransferase
MKLGYVSARFPFALAEQFFEPEVESLADVFDVVLFPTRATSARNRYPGLPASAHYMGALDGSVLRLAVREIARAPLAALRAFAVVAFARSALRARIVNLALFPKALALASEARRLGIEHLHVNWLTSSATIVYVAARLTGIPFSITAHQHDIFYDNLTVRKVRDAQFVRVISARNCAHLRELVPPELRAKCVVVHLGVRLPAAPAEPPAGRTTRILCSARMCVWKGHRYLLAALARMRDEGVAFTCDFAGDGEIEAEVAKLVATYRLGDRVTMLGNVPHAELVESLESGTYDLAVLASTERGGEHEGIPVALMEAMAAELPVVATRTGSIPELVDAENGILVDQADPIALAAALSALVRDPKERRRLGRNGRRRVLAAFETGETTRTLTELLVRSAPWFRGNDGEVRGPEVPRVGALGRFSD